jgi:SAM-dependent methyltransferase
MNFADLKRFEPFCEKWGESRGGAIDRFYIDAYLRLELKRVRGHILECGGQRYRTLLPSQHVASYDVVDLNPRTPFATICGDIQHLKTIATGTYDVVICTQVLQYVDDPMRALSELHRILCPGGRLLLSVPFIEKDYVRMGDNWRFTKKSVKLLLSPFRRSEVTTGGNLFSSVCYLLGLGQADVSPSDLNRADRSFYQLVLAKAWK